MRESTLVQNIQKAVRAHHPRAYIRKIADAHTRGLPDLLIVFPANNPNLDGVAKEVARVLFVETKTKDGRLSAIQRAESLAIGNAAGDFLVARDVDIVLWHLHDMGALP